MSLTINAWMESNQEFCLNIFNCETGATEVQWRFDPKQLDPSMSHQELKHLFKQLLLLSCKARVSD
ncbi:hypothetical protein MIB92_17945 [Aestuariirhabdus sp. Z084]|uniref:hypothetical protein n=1 Tax=Aestuariirhabdus haliotis TaxID=2918751 RepID=UPI00201B39AC|nr:hypothetical protein [Aestuariirhabdus haliotis]MCL6417548.1 hypothetical protein [Aestuariirhabdus haliotis]MCL6421497.1 hypothetical protein [Aestuariirhabdus haliotis]